MVLALMRRLYGSDDLFPDDRMNAYHPHQSVNYILANRLVEATVAPLVEPLIRRVSADILNAVKDRLEHHRVAHDLPVL